MNTRGDSQESVCASDREFLALVEALRDLETNLFQIAGAMNSWLNEIGIDAGTVESLVMSELLEIVGAVSDRPLANDDVLAGLLLFVLQADLADEPIELRRLFATVAQPGMSAIFDDEQDLFCDSERITSLTRPSRFIFNMFLTFDKLLIQFSLTPRFVEMYLGAFASFVVKVLESSVLVDDTAQVLFRSGTFCAARLQFQELLVSSPSCNLEDAKHSFHFDFGDSNALDFLKSCLAFSVRFNDDYMAALARTADSFTSLVRASKDGSDDEGHTEDTTAISTFTFKTPKDRMVELQELLESGLITQTEYERKRDAIIEEI